MAYNGVSFCRSYWTISQEIRDCTEKRLEAICNRCLINTLDADALSGKVTQFGKNIGAAKKAALSNFHVSSAQITNSWMGFGSHGLHKLRHSKERSEFVARLSKYLHCTCFSIDYSNDSDHFGMPFSFNSFNCLQH